MATRDDLAAVTKFEQTHFKVGAPYTREQFDHIFEIGDILIIRDKTGSIIGIAALTYGPRSHVLLKLTDTDAYYSDMVFSPEWRGRGLAAPIYKIMEELAHKRNTKRAFGCIAPCNSRSMRAAEKAGFRSFDTRTNFMPECPEYGDNGTRILIMKVLEEPTSPPQS